MNPTPTKKAYLTTFPFITHLPELKYCIKNEPFFNPEYNDWYWINIPPSAHHPINSINKSINPFRNLFAELVVTGQVTWDGSKYTIGDPNGFWHTCKKYNIKPTFPPTPIFTAPTGDPYCFQAIAEYYKLFGTYNDVTSTHFWDPYYYPTPIRRLNVNFQFPFINQSPFGKRKHYLECSDTSTSEDSKVQSQTKRPKQGDPKV